MTHTRRDALKTGFQAGIATAASLLLNGGLGAALFAGSGCGTDPRKIITPINYVPPSPKTLDDSAPQFSSRTTTVSSRDNYLTGKLETEASRVHLTFADRNGNTIDSAFSDLLIETEFIADVQGKRWAYDLRNLARYHGPFTLTKIETDRDSETLALLVTPENRPVNTLLPFTNAAERTSMNAYNLMCTSMVFINHRGIPVTITDGKDQTTLQPRLLATPQHYDNGIDRNTDLVRRMSTIYVHANSLYPAQPLRFLKTIYVDEINDGGHARRNFIRLGIKGSVGAEEHIKAGVWDLEAYMPKLTLDSHEISHVCDLNEAIAGRDEFRRLSWTDIRTTRPGINPEDFVTGYAQTDWQEDLAETADWCVAFGDRYRERMAQNGASDILRKKYEILTRDLIGREYGRQDISDLFNNV